jgi:NADP-dependent 3-hydroxy acid dehydrogenase YdfG
MCCVQVQEAYQMAIKRFGSVDYLLLNAGTSDPGYFQEVSSRGSFQKLMNINYHGIVNVLNAGIPDMIQVKKVNWLFQRISF